ncbi:hypothetical protein GO986_19265 [Deinococcus sp. HMF7620]|uniref:Uncharacterized protein n=1 Tax=Deinococcus arboris TaxID=2682977 RepID=A0A7C9M8U5_9DEIO|nr:hypothetical protein [Deinococcus arboris]MVN88885.1 hypothetical protein [Deinococcus arboris]
MKRVLSLVSLVLSSVALAGSGQMSTPVRLTVQPVCEVQSVTPERVTLHCTRNYVPSVPHDLPQLLGKLPLAELRLTNSAPAPSGGTLNTYAVQPLGAAGELVFY